MCYICWSESTKIFCTNDFICCAIWRHLSFLPYQFSIFYDVGGCVLVAVVWKRWTTPNNTQQHATGWKNVTQHVTPWKTLGVVSTCWPAMLRPFALCSGLSKWQAINSLPKSRRVRTPSRKKNTCGSILVSKNCTLNIRFWGGRLREVRINTCVRLSETKRRAEARYIFKDIQFNDSRRLHELGLRSIDLSYNHIGIYRSSAVAK